jgi:site-specific DNA-methyltransferase (adenine-specific)
MAWTNLPPGQDELHRQQWEGRIRAGEGNGAKRDKYHPAEKPIELMRWCVAKTTGTVLDPYMGSGTTGEACLRLGRPFVGIELDPTIFALACDRLAAAAQQLQLFSAS